MTTTPEKPRAHCPKCKKPLVMPMLLMGREGRQVRVFKCECGEMVWDD